MKKKFLSLIVSFCLSSITFGQVGINTTNPQGVFNVDGAKDNALTGTPSKDQQGNDFIVKKTGQTSIGTTTPSDYSMLTVTSIDKQRGITIPNVNLINTTLDLNSDGDGDISNQPVGLMVFNIGSVLPKGYYFWNGNEWRNIDNSTVTLPAIQSLRCASATLTPRGYTANQVFTGTLTVPYVGGNEGSYESGNSVTVNGLTFKLRGGRLSDGNGELVFSVTGAPTVSSPDTTTIDIDENLIPFLTSSQGCSVTVGNTVTTNTANVESSAVMDNFKYTTDGGVPGYEVRVTSPDEKFSVRAFIVSKDFDAAASSFGTDNLYGINLQIRNNLTTDVAISEQLDYMFAGMGGNGYNMLGLISGKWSGDQQASAANSTPHWAGYLDGTAPPINGISYECKNPELNKANVSKCRYVSWGNSGVYASGIPEYRYYSWTVNDQGAIPVDKTFYILTFSSSTAEPAMFGNTINCPGGVCHKAKAYLKLEQIKAQSQY